MAPEDMIDPMELRAPGVILTIDVRRGGRLAGLRVGDRELLVRSAEVGDDPLRWGCYVMAPWVGRMEGATLEWAGARHRFAATDGPHALHGLVLDRPWHVERAARASVTLAIDLAAVGWPFGGALRHRIALAADRVEFAAALAADEPAPVALGWHPWFATSGDPAASLRLDAGEVLELRDDLVPTGRRVPVDTRTDLRDGPALAGRALDDVYPGARAPAVLDAGGFEIAIRWSRTIRAVVVHSPALGTCVEPVTAWPNAARLAARRVPGTGLVSLPAGGTLRAWMRWSWPPAHA